MVAQNRSPYPFALYDCIPILLAVFDFSQALGSPRNGLRLSLLGEKHSMFRAIIHWVLSAIALVVATNIVPGFYINDVQSALVAALVIGILNATLGFIIKVLTFPFAIVTFGIFLLVVNAAMILLAAKIVPGFVVYGWVPAFWAAVILAILGMLIRALMKDQ